MLLKKLTSSEAAHYLRYSENTLRRSRITGVLAGTRAPVYIKIGGRIFYDKSNLDDWINGFSFQNNTSQN